jgi:hypothetical protein
MSIKQRLRPLVVPWCVAPSTPFLTLHSSENDDETYIHFVAFNKLLAPASSYNSGQSVVVSEMPSDFREISPGESGCYQLMRAYFRHVLWTRMSPSFSESEVIEEGAYDWSLVRGEMWQSKEIDQLFADYTQKWRETGLCPEPGIYEVEHSEWIASLRPPKHASAPRRHFLVAGHDCYAEIIAKEIFVKAGQVLEGW